MQIFLNILFLAIGMVLLIKGADFFVDGASSVAKKLKVPALFIGLTIIALGTSLPELSVSVASAVKNSTDMSVGNIIGSNMMNMFLILGIVILIKPVPVHKSSKKIDFPFLIGITLLLLLFCADKFINRSGENIITRSESIVLIATLVVYIFMLIFNAKKEHKAMFNEGANYIEQPKEDGIKILKTWQIILCLLIGPFAIVLGAEFVSTTAQFLALKMGMSEALVGLTIVAVGTSLPELTTNVIAAVKGENNLALGNIIGSSVINIALILGVVGTITQISISTTLLIDVLILTVCTIIFSVLCMTKNKISRWKGAVFVLMYIAYMTFAIVRNYCF